MILDRDLAVLYNVSTKRLNEQVKRNSERFPDSFKFQLTEQEKNEVVAKCDHLVNLKFSTILPYAFTEQGVAMISTVLKSEIAVNVSIRIMTTFVEMRRQRDQFSLFDARISSLEKKQLVSEEQFERVFNFLENTDTLPKQGIFFDGQIFDAYTLVADIIRSAKQSIILIDNYIDDTVLTLLTKREKTVSVVIYTQKISKQLELDLIKHNQQYPPIQVVSFQHIHDRFMVIDQSELYHIGASLKDLGKKWVAFSKMNTFLETVLITLKNDLQRVKRVS